VPKKPVVSNHFICGTLFYTTLKPRAEARGHQNLALNGAIFLKAISLTPFALDRKLRWKFSIFAQFLSFYEQRF
jgi:hypothetical protein